VNQPPVNKFLLTPLVAILVYSKIMAQNNILLLTHANGKDARNGLQVLNKQFVSMKLMLFQKDGRPACSNAVAIVLYHKTTKL
jgi:hypothetical protein